LPGFRIALVCDFFTADLKALQRRHPDLKERVISKLRHLAEDPIGLSDRLQNTPQCFKARVGADFRIVFTLRGDLLIPFMLYAKNRQQDVNLERLFGAIDAIIDRAKE
jgi:mRNA-degrading endonuclease RelE of RelBE toxin-antitoxin system